MESSVHVTHSNNDDNSNHTKKKAKVQEENKSAQESLSFKDNTTARRCGSSSSSQPKTSSYSSSLESLVEAAKQDELKFVFVGGKGGVGKTTSSSAIASLLASKCHKRVLLVSTDPAHSLGDAWRTSFTNVPMRSPIDKLDIMELDPSEMMKNEVSTWMEYAKEFTSDYDGVNSSSSNDEIEDDDNSILGKIKSIKEWIVGIPGIDEATALSAAITHIESGKYDMIVFDTAPTGHTLKLFHLPDILEKGLEKLSSWQSTLWGYWDSFKLLNKGFSSSANSMRKKNQIRAEISQKMMNYKDSIQKVGNMLQDQQRTRFIVVCIAEFLSISETQRLLRELFKHQVHVSHIIVNQLVIADTLSNEELVELESLAEVKGFESMNPVLVKKMLHTCQHTTARKNIQQKYLAVLKGYKETQQLIEGICEVPLMSEEVTGPEAIFKFAKRLLHGSNAVAQEDDGQPTLTKPNVGDIVRITALTKNVDLNGIEGQVETIIDGKTGRCGIVIIDPRTEKSRKLALLPKNLSIVRFQNEIGSSMRMATTSFATVNDEGSNNEMETSRASSLSPVDSSSTESSSKKASNCETISIVTKAMEVLEDPEIKIMIEQEPRVKAAIEDCMKNPINFMKYIADPVLSPFIAKAMKKM